MTLCEYCGKEFNVTYICSNCGGRYCKNHRQRVVHLCKSQKKEPYEHTKEEITKEEAIDSIPYTEIVNDLVSEPNVSGIKTLQAIKEDDTKNEQTQVEIEEKQTITRIYKPYKDFTSVKPRKKTHHQSTNIFKIPKTLGKWIVITGSFYVIVYGLFKFLEFMSTFKI